LIETRAQICLGTGKIGEAFQLMDQMSEVGPFFAAKLNELGIRLSQAGKGKSALALYQKAHKIVRSELKYKISLNAALACRRLQEFDMALKYIIRCRKEYGS
jgi:tetratricopeptide (TPR) repeat protein